MAAVDEKKVLQKVELPATDALTFIGKYDTERKQELAVNNQTDATIAYKLKITAPKLVKLQPGYGYVKPKEKGTIVVTARPYRDGPKPPARERVVVLLSVAPETRPENPVQFWRGATAPKDPRRTVFPLKFLEEAKVKKEKGGKEDKGKDKDAKGGKKDEKKDKGKKGDEKEDKTGADEASGSEDKSGGESSGEESDADEKSE